MTSTTTPNRAVVDALVDVFRDSVAWSGTAAVVGNATGLLFPSWSPRLDVADYRVYSRYANLPEIPQVKQALPRITLDARWTPHQYEQEQVGTLHGPVTVYLHVTVPRDREEYGDLLTATAINLVLSTPLSSARIIAAELALTSDVSKEPITAFNDAWEQIAVFRSQSVGVLQ
jgi:hypothetical protein